MGNNNYLIPANSKKSMLILGLFNTTDLVIFATGMIVSFVLMLSIQTNDIKTALLILTPALVCTFLIVPLPNQHNVRTFIKNVYTYYTNNRVYYWKGWCNSYGKTDDR